MSNIKLFKYVVISKGFWVSSVINWWVTRNLETQVSFELAGIQAKVAS